MYQIKLIPLTGKWKVVLPSGDVLGEKYSSGYQACKKLTAYLKGQQ